MRYEPFIVFNRSSWSENSDGVETLTKWHGTTTHTRGGHVVCVLSKSPVLIPHECLSTSTSIFWLFRHPYHSIIRTLIVVLLHGILFHHRNAQQINKAKDCENLSSNELLGPLLEFFHFFGSRFRILSSAGSRRRC